MTLLFIDSELFLILVFFFEFKKTHKLMFISYTVSFLPMYLSFYVMYLKYRVTELF